ncbi:hypothetical protein [Virgibacillus kimchii]
MSLAEGEKKKSYRKVQWYVIGRRREKRRHIERANGMSLAEGEKKTSYRRGQWYVIGRRREKDVL